MAASVITPVPITDDTGTPASPNEDGTILNNAWQNNSIYAPINQLLSGAGLYTTLRFGGLIAGEGFGSYTFIAGGSGGQILAVRNTSAGTTNYSGVNLGNDGSATAGMLLHTSSTYTAALNIPQDGLLLTGTRAGGVAISATHASGPLSMYTGGTTRRWHMDSSGRIGIGLDAQTDSQMEILAGAAGRRGLVVQGVDDSPAIEALMGSGASGSGYGIWITGGADANDFPFFIQNAASQAILAVDALGKFLIGGGSVNNFMTTGIQIHQDDNDDEIMCFRSSDVGHGMTDIVHTETYGDFLKSSPADGGLSIRGFTQGNLGLVLQGIVTNANTLMSTSAVGAVTIDGILKSGATVTDMSASAWLLVVRNRTNARFAVEADGDIHFDGTSNAGAWDDHSDVSLLAGLRGLMTGQERFARFVDYARPVLERTRVVTFNDDGHHFVSMKGALGLTWDALRQEALRTRALIATLSPRQRAKYLATLQQQELEAI